MHIFRPRAVALALAMAFSASAFAADAYLRFPAISQSALVFTAEGDLWKSAPNGGNAQRLTTHAGMESNAALSRDGKWLAFSAAYEGTQEAYVMPLEGGQPKRLTFENAGVSVLGWTAQGQVLVSYQNAQGPAASRVVASIDPLSGHRHVYPVADANDAALDDAGKVLYFTRFGMAIRNDNVKRYRGGAFGQLWRFELDGAHEATLLFKDEANHRRPMLWQGRLYTISDEGGSDNLWSTKLDGSDARMLTKHLDWDVRNASLGDGKIVYQLGADLRVFDLASNQDTALKLALVSDYEQTRTHQVRAPLESLTSIRLASKAQRIVITARGHVAVAGTGTQRRVEIAIPEGARARNAVMSHDDKWVYAIVDATGENEIWRFAADGSGKGEALTKDGANQRQTLLPSPDGKWLAHTDKRGRLYLLDLALRSNTVIDDAAKAGLGSYSGVEWSADSKALAFVRAATAQRRDQIGLYLIDDKAAAFVTSDRYVSYSPVFSPDGRWLYFFSDRHFQLSNGSPWGDRNTGAVFDKRTGMYALALQPGNRFPFKADDELSKPESEAAPATPPADAKPAAGADAKASADTKAGADTKASADAKPAAKPAKASLPGVVLAGLADRLYEVPLAAGNYRDLSVDDKRLYFLDADGNEGRSSLKTLAISRTAPQPEVFAANVRSYDMSADRKHIYYRSFSATGPGDILVLDAAAKAPTDLSKSGVRIDDWNFTVNPRLEWKQMFHDAWRMHRDYLYDTNMRGVDWNAMRSKYAPLAERVNDRAELDDLLGMMISEVGSLHSQIRPGDVRRAAPEGTPSSLGAVFSQVKNGFRVDHIYRGEAELPSDRGPLATPDADVRTGDIITAVNGKSAAGARDISDMLLNQTGKQVLLQVQRGATPARQIIVTPVSMARHADLRYGDWEQGRAAQVATASQGKIGYLHLRAMGPGDMASFTRNFYANLSMDGLIIDVRRNNGGNIDSWIIEKLLRKAWAFWAANGGTPYANMQSAFRGHVVVLIDELTYSDGETFAAGIKALKLAPVIGKRTSGAGAWLSDGNRLADNGQARAAETPQFTMDGNWMIEGVGVLPDVEVDNLPNESFKGRDRQLEKALELLTAKLKEQPLKPQTPQAIPRLQR